MTATQDTTTGQEADKLCPDCGYDLRGMPADSGRCPECGLAIDPTALAVSLVPWAHRRQIGHVRAYLKTVALVTLRPRRFVGEVSRAADPGDGVFFRWITLPLVLAPLGFLTAMESPFDPSLVAKASRDVAGGNASLAPWAAPWMYGAQSAAVRVICVAAALYAVTGAAAWLLRRFDLTPERRARAEALSQYTCAPLLAVPVVFVAGWAIGVLAPQTFFVVSAYYLCAVTLLGLGVLEWWWVQVLLVHRATRSPGRAVAFAALMPVTWVLFTALTLFVIPWLSGWVLILIASC